VNRLENYQEFPELLRLLARGTAGAAGGRFYADLARCLAEVLRGSTVFISEFVDQGRRARPIACWRDGEPVDLPEYAVAGTPCEAVLGGGIAAFPRNVRDLFPRDRKFLEAFGADSYLAVPVSDDMGGIIGHLAVVDRQPRDWNDIDFDVLGIVAARAGSELLRRRAEQALAESNRRLQQEIDKRRRHEEALIESESAYRSLYEDAPVAYWSTAADRRVKRVNKAITDFIGYTPDEVVGEPLAKFMAPTPDGEGVAKGVFEKFLRGESTIGQEVEFRHKEGHHVWASVSVTPILDGTGRPLMTRSVIVDITQRKRAEKELQRRLDLENLIAAASSRFAQADIDRVDAEINRCLEEVAAFYDIERTCIYLFSEDKSIAQHTHSWSAPELSVPPSERQLCTDNPALFADLLDGRIIGVRMLDELPAGYEKIRQRLQAGRICSIAIVPLSSGTEVAGMLLVEAARNETDWPEEDLRLLRLLGEIIASTLARRDAETKLREARRAAEAASRAKTEFLANMSHELRTPLNGILGYAQVLARDASLDRRNLESVHGIRHCGEHLLDLVNEVLDLARIEAGRLVLRPEEVDLSALLGEVADITRVRCAEAGLAFVHESVAVLPQTVRADPRALRQILLNLLGNAVKFTTEGEVRFRISGKRLSGRRWHLTFDVKDSGYGIPPEEQARIFEPFHRIPLPERSIEGTGLGLTITSSLVQAMGGQLRVESTPGRGSLFTVEVELDGSTARERAVAPKDVQIAGYRGRRRTLLIADDKPDNRAVLRQLLEPLGFIICEAASGREALELAQARSPDLILLDLVMPELDGFEVARRLRADQQLGATPILAVSASAFDDTRRQSMESGCDDFLSKPVRLDAVLGKLERHLGLQWTHSGAAGNAQPAAAGSEPELPSEVAERLYDFALRGDIAEFNSCLRELESSGGHARILADLDALARNFDMKGIRARLRLSRPGLS
jgi:PAS domain S-box-containing protein